MVSDEKNDLEKFFGKNTENAKNTQKHTKTQKTQPKMAYFYEYFIVRGIINIGENPDVMLCYHIDVKKQFGSIPKGTSIEMMIFHPLTAYYEIPVENGSEIKEIYDFDGNKLTEDQVAARRAQNEGRYAQDEGN